MFERGLFGNPYIKLLTDRVKPVILPLDGDFRDFGNGDASRQTRTLDAVVREVREGGPYADYLRGTLNDNGNSACQAEINEVGARLTSADPSLGQRFWNWWNSR